MIGEIVFPVSGTAVPTDHSYQLYAALARIVPQFHEPAVRLRFAPLTGIGSADGRMQLKNPSYLIVRLPSESIRVALPLAGKSLILGESRVRLGVPTVRTLVPAPTLLARIVTFKNADTPEEFLATARTKLTALGIAGDPQLPLHLTGEFAGTPKRRVIRVKGVAIVGYSLLVAELSAADSLKLQEQGLGGRTQMGCGWFGVVREVK